MCSRTNMYRNIRDCDCLFTEIPRTFMIDKVLIKNKTKLQNYEYH